MTTFTNKTQREIVLDHMLEYGSITSIEAFEDHKITRISAVIFDLKNVDKIQIKMEREKITLDGKTKSFGRYSLVPSQSKSTASQQMGI